jgi:hypothetical protein
VFAKDDASLSSNQRPSSDVKVRLSSVDVRTRGRCDVENLSLASALHVLPAYLL